MFSRSALQYPYIPTVLLYFNQLNFAILKYTMSVYNHFTSPPLQLIRSHSTIQNNQISHLKLCNITIQIYPIIHIFIAKL